MVQSALSGRKILIGVTGSVGSVRIPELVEELRLLGAQVVVCSSEAGERLLPGAGSPEMIAFAERECVCEWDLMIIVPSTANSLSKLAFGIGDTVVTHMGVLTMGQGIPLLLVPAMHGSMYEHPLVKENRQRLMDLGVLFLEQKEQNARVPETFELVEYIKSLWSG